MNSSSDSLHIDENLARLLAACDQGIDGIDAAADPQAPTIGLPRLAPLPGEHVVPPLSGNAPHEGSLAELLPSTSSLPPARAPVQTPGPIGGTHRIGRFELRRQLGKGGCGIVFLAFDPRLEREVALKIPRPEMLLSQDARRRLIREALAAAEFDHPNLVPVYETGEIGPICFIATAFCPGQTLGEWLDKQAFPVPVRQAARLVAIVAEAVQHAHDRGVLHRDLKPNNVILQPTKDDPNETEPPPGSCYLRGDCFVPRVVDFGLAKLVERGGPSETTTRQILGTPKYMAPEQAQARHDDVGPAADVYALGVILYEMIAGRAPYEGASDVEVLRLVIDGDLVTPRHIRADIPRDLEAICLKAMECLPGKRFRTAIDFADDLRRFLDGKPTLARPLKWTGRAGKWLRRNDQAVALGVVTTVAVVLLALGFWSMRQTRLSRDERDSVLRDQAARTRSDLDREYPRLVRAAFLAWKAGDTKAAAESLEGASKVARMGMESTDFAHDYLARLIAAQRLSIVCPAGPVTALAVSADGTQIATGHPDGTVALWESATGNAIASIRGHERPVIHAELSRPGELVTADSFGNRKSWSFGPTGLKAGPKLPMTAPASAAAECLVRQGSVAFTGGEDGVVRVWNTPSDSPLCQTIAFPESLLAAGIHPESDRIVVIAREDVLQSFQGIARQPALSMGQHRFRALRFTLEGQLLGVEIQDHKATVCEIDTEVREKLRAATGPSAAAATVAELSFHGQRLVVGDEQGQVTMWNVAQRVILATIDIGNHAPVRQAAVSDDGRLFAATVGDGVSVWMTGEASPFASFGSDRPSLIRFLPGEDRMLTAGSGNTVRLWGISSGQEELTFRGHVGRVTALGISPDGRTLVSGSTTGEVKFWDLRTGQELLAFRRHTGPVTVVDFALNGRELITGATGAAGSGELAIWDLARN